MIPGPPRLEDRIARRTLRRLARLRRLWTAAGPRIGALLQTLDALPVPTRRRLLYGPDLRGFLGEAEIWLEIRRCAGLALHAAGPDRRARARARLFDRIASTEHLATLVPRQHLDPGLPRRAVSFARLRLQRALQDLALCLVGARIAWGPEGRIEVACSLASEPEQGRPGTRIDLGTIAGPAGALTLVFRGRRRPRRVSIGLQGRLLTVRIPGRAPVLVPAPGSRLQTWGPPPGRGGGEGRMASVRLARRETIPGTAILLAPELHSSPRRLRVGREIPGLGPRLARALRIVRLAWPEGHREILAQTFVVVPVREPGLVSYSLASRPGVSFINIAGKTSFDLADDLLHESAHHRLHAMQEIARYIAPGPQTTDVQAFDSPWRGTRRPLHGLLHGAYTFRFRAELIDRVLRMTARRRRLIAPLLRPRDRAWLRGELRRERAMLARARADLGRAARDGLLTTAGSSLLRSLPRRPSRR